MSASRTPLLTWALVACGFVGALVLWILLRAPSGVSDPAESGEHASTVASAREPLAPPAETESAGTTEARGEQVRVELPRSPDTVGPRKTHAKVELVCGLSGTGVDAMLRRIQVRADCDEVVVDETAANAVFAVRTNRGVWVADVTPLLIGASELPNRLRVVAESERCNAVADAPLGLTARELSSPSRITLSTRLNFDCPWRVRGRIVAPCPAREVRVFGDSLTPSDATRAIGAYSLTIEEDGRFEWRSQLDGPHRLEFRAPNVTPRGLAFEIVGQEDVELGDILLEAGATLRGQLLAAGEPLAHADLAIVRSDERLQSTAELDHANLTHRGWLTDAPALRHVLEDLGLLEQGVVRPGTSSASAAVLVVSTDVNGRFETSALRSGEHLLIPISSRGAALWLAPLRTFAPSFDVVHDFDARSVRFEFLDPKGEILRKRVPCLLRAQLPNDATPSLGVDSVFYGELHALIRPGTLLNLRACGQELLIPVRASPEPLVQSVSPCSVDPATSK